MHILTRINSHGHCVICRVFDQGWGRKMFKRDMEMSDADCNLDYLFTEQIIAASPGEALNRLLDLIDEAGPFGTLILMSYDWHDKACIWS